MTTEINNQDNAPVEDQEEKVTETPAAETRETEAPAETSETAAVETSETEKTSGTADEAKTQETADTANTQEKKTEESKERKPASGEEPRRERPQGEGYQRRDSSQRFPKFRRKVCYFCANKNAEIDYKDADTLGRFITDRGKILPRRVTGVCARHQRGLANAIKKARIIALIPFIEK